MAAQGLTIGVRVDDIAVRDGLRDARRGLYLKMKAIQQDAATDIIMPAVRRRQPSIARGTLIAKATRSSAYITTIARGMKRRTIGLLEYGGTVTGTIRPRSPGVRAIPVAPGVFRAAVYGPRHYTAKRFMAGAVEQRFDAYAIRLRDDVADYLQRQIDGGFVR